MILWKSLNIKIVVTSGGFRGGVRPKRAIFRDRRLKGFQRIYNQIFADFQPILKTFFLEERGSN
jgi:hypothetical protein